MQLDLSKVYVLDTDIPFKLQPEAKGQFKLSKKSITCGKGQEIPAVFSAEFEIETESALNDIRVSGFRASLRNIFAFMGLSMFNKMTLVSKMMGIDNRCDCTVKLVNLRKKFKGFVKVKVDGKEILLPLQSYDELIVKDGQTVNLKDLDGNKV